MKKLLLKCIALLCLLLTLAFEAKAQNIFGGEGVNWVGSINGYSQPTNLSGDYRVLQYRKVSTNASNPTDGRGQWTTTINVQNSGGNVTPANMPGGGGAGFLFTSGPSGNQYQNKWNFSGVGQGALDAVNGIGHNQAQDMGLNMSATGRYTFVLKDAGYASTGFYVGYTSNNPVTMSHNSGTQLSVANGAGSITATLSGAPSPQEKFFVRYRTTNDFSSTANIVQANVAGSTISATIPNLGAVTVYYYIFSSTRTLSQLTSGADTDIAYQALRYADNSGNNYSYTVPAVPAQPGAISGNAAPCQNSTQTYSVANDPLATSYVWNLPVGWTGTSTTNSISVTVGTGGGTLSVSAVNAGGTGTARTLPVSPAANVTYYQDADNDGFGNPDVPQTACTGAPVGYVADNTDCDDSNTAMHQTFAFYADNDGDSYGAGNLVSVCAVDANTPPVGYSLSNSDCNDGDNSVYQNGTLYVDADNDGYTSGATQIVCYGAMVPSGFVAVLTDIDCNDSVAAIHTNAPEIPYNGFDDDCDGSVDETGTITTALLPSSCGTTLASIGSLIGIQTVAGHNITGYRIRVTNGAQEQIIEKNVPHFAMTQFGSYAYATTYTVEIQLQRAGLWQASWGASCLVSTPAILEEGGAASVSPSQCGITLPKINTLVATTSLAGVTGYRFRITNLTDTVGPNAVQTIDRTQNWFSLQMLTRYNYGTTYRIEVAVKTTGAFGGFGSPCEVSSPMAPSLVNCGGTVASKNTLVAATSAEGVTQYRFQVTRQSDNASTTIDRNVNYFTFNAVPAAAFTGGVLYNVRVAVMTKGTWSPFGDICEITSPGAVAKGMAVSAINEEMAFKATVYPNPFTADFNIGTTPAEGKVGVKVYNMLGKLIESKQIEADVLHAERLGGDYPSGVYQVIISRGEERQTRRIIKR